MYEVVAKVQEEMFAVDEASKKKLWSIKQGWSFCNWGSQCSIYVNAGRRILQRFADLPDE
jgi:hypothetical protein